MIKNGTAMNKVTQTNTEGEAMKREKNHVVYNRASGEAISYHRSEALADSAARRIDPALRTVTSKRIK